MKTNCNFKLGAQQRTYLLDDNNFFLVITQKSEKSAKVIKFLGKCHQKIGKWKPMVLQMQHFNEI